MKILLDQGLLRSTALLHRKNNMTPGEFHSIKLNIVPPFETTGPEHEKHEESNNDNREMPLNLGNLTLLTSWLEFASESQQLAGKQEQSSTQPENRHPRDSFPQPSARESPLGSLISPQDLESFSWI